MERLKNSRGASFAVIALIYLLAAAVGLAVYRLLPYAFWLKLLLADLAATGFVFVFSLLFKNASVYDPYWSVQPLVILPAFAIGQTLTPPRLLVLLAVLLWGLRLTANWAYTFRGLAFQDWRYTMLQEKTGRCYPLINLVGIHLVPTLVVYFCVLPAVFLFQTESVWNAGSLFGFLLSVFALTMQGVADFQMHRFRRQKAGGLTQESFLRSGLWKYARHPNYLGEILMWWGVCLSAVSVLPQSWFLLTGALANTCLFLFVSIPLAEGRQAQKAGYNEYRKATRMLLPVIK